MTLKLPGAMDCYNSLTDEYLVDYFNNRRIRKHLRNMGLITKRGEVVNEPTFRYNAARKDHRAHVKELMSQAVVNKTLELERNRRAFIRDKLIEIRKIETVNRIKRERDSRDEGLEFCSGRPKSAPSKIKGRLEGECVAGVSIPPGSRVRWVPLIMPPSGSTPYLAPVGPGYCRSSRERPRSAMVRSKQQAHQIKKPRPKSASSNTSTVASSTFSTFIQRRQIHSMSRITLRYLGKSLDLSPGVFGDAVEILIMQQHCGGNTVCVYQGLVSPNECFTFTSRRHRDAPFGITIYIGSMQDTRLSTCCEYRHKPGHILGGKSGHFALVRVDGCLPCYKCFAHVDEFKKQQSAAHANFQKDVDKKKEKGKKKKKNKVKKVHSESSSSSEDEADKHVLQAKVTVKPTKPEDKTPINVPNDHQILDISEDDMRQFEKLVVKSDNIDEEDVLVLHSSGSEDGETPQTKPEDEVKVESDISEDERKKDDVLATKQEPTVTIEIDTNGYGEEGFHSDNEDDNKSDISETSHKSDASIKSDKSDASKKSDTSSTSSKSSNSSSAIKSDKNDQEKSSSVSSIKSEDSINGSIEDLNKVGLALTESTTLPSATSGSILPSTTDTSAAPTRSSVAEEASPRRERSPVQEVPISAPPKSPVPPREEATAKPDTSPIEEREPSEDTDTDKPAEKIDLKQDAGPGSTSQRLSSELSDSIKEFLGNMESKDPDHVPNGDDYSDNDSVISFHSNNSETTTNPSAAPAKVLSPTQSILSTESSKSKADHNRRIRFSDQVIRRVASEDEED